MTGRAEMPELREQRVMGHKAELTIVLPAGLIYFEGHFPGLPILPAVAQLHFAIAYAAQLLGVSGPVTSVRALKFRRPLQPGEELALHLEWQAERQALRFAYLLRGDIVSSGRINYGA